MIKITISGEEYERCAKYSNNNWGSSKPGRYGKGLGNEGKDVSKIERISKLSELAVSKLLCSHEPDYSYKKYGDGGHDLVVQGLKVDVKVAMRDYGANVFKGINHNLTSTVKADIYVFCYLSKEIAKHNTAELVVVGYLTKEDILKLPLVQPRIKFTTECVNYDIKHSQMIPIDKLITELGLDN